MQATTILQYPEFTLAILAGFVLLVASQPRADWHWPNWLAEPAKTFLSYLPANYLQWIGKSIVEAGWRYNQSFGDFASYKLYLPLASVLLAIIAALHFVVLTVVILFFIPDLVLFILVKRRQKEIRDALPQALDLLVLCVDAGLGLEAALHRIALDNHGIAQSLYDELNILGRDILLGMDRERAYQELYNRTGVDELKTFGSALGQASKLGLSISRILRAQGEFIRKKQSQKIEEKAMKMPIFMAFPLWFCIMPSLMLLVLGPSLIKFYHQLH